MRQPAKPIEIRGSKSLLSPKPRSPGAAGPLAFPAGFALAELPVPVASHHAELRERERERERETVTRLFSSAWLAPSKYCNMDVKNRLLLWPVGSEVAAPGYKTRPCFVTVTVTVPPGERDRERETGRERERERERESFIWNNVQRGVVSGAAR